MKKPKPDAAERIIRGLKDLRDVLRRGEKIGTRFKITKRRNP